MKILIDTNILVHAHNASSPHQEKASHLIIQAMESKTQPILLPQNLYEFFAVVTNPRRIENPLSVEEAISICEDFWFSEKMIIIEPTTTTTLMVFSLIEEYKIKKARIFDCVIAATALEFGIGTIYTENTRDFEDFSFLEIINPFNNS
ncbi:MAG: PIN domain-containing protein [Candidatus Lokiarchaeota archaeon]|nr:PIN domain-containing protein [Candidatus Lokiarchaeota archaeon]